MIRLLGIPGNREKLNTETSHQIGSVEFGGEKSKSTETLYKSPKGTFFLHGKGGVLSRWEGQENIVALDNKQARFWLKKHGVIC